MEIKNPSLEGGVLVFKKNIYYCCGCIDAPCDGAEQSNPIL
jgi:hypothetical protein